LTGKLHSRLTRLRLCLGAPKGAPRQKDAEGKKKEIKKKGTRKKEKGKRKKEKGNRKKEHLGFGLGLGLRPRQESQGAIRG
jgi:hypothetical protein